MRIIFTILISCIFVAGTAFAQDTTKDRDYQNFKRNFERTLKSFKQLESNSNPRVKRTTLRNAKYARTFLDKLIKKYGESRFAAENQQLKAIENALALSVNAERSSRDKLAYLKLWMHRLSPNGLNNASVTSNLQDFDNSKLRKVYRDAKKRR